jgi:hypothetical protein
MRSGSSILGRPSPFVAGVGECVLIMVLVKTDGKFSAGQTQKLFRLPAHPDYRTPYAVSADGRRFLVAVPGIAESPCRLMVMTNWMETRK